MKKIIGIVLLTSLVLNVVLAYKGWRASQPPDTAHTTQEMVVMRTPGGLLEVSTVKAEERFDSNTSHSVLGVDVGKTVAQIRVPTVYRYHIPLAKDWRFRLMGDALMVMAPKVQASLPVAIDTAKLEAFSTGIWSPITGQDAIDSLQRSITARLAQKAVSPQMLLLQREPARQTITEFVQKWVVEQAQWKDKKRPTIFVFFEDEPLGAKAASFLSAGP